MDIYDIKRIIANDENKSVGLPEPEYGTDGSFVWITFKRPNPDTYSDTTPDNQSVTGSDYKIVLTDKQKEVVAYCIIPRSSREILKHIDVTYQNRNIMKFITTLIENGYLARTIPDSPYSPLQKYVAIRRVM